MNSKAIRKQLLAAVAMVLVAAVALGSSTYAWFVASGTVTATGMQVNAISEGGLAISYGRSAWGISATATDAQKALKPTSTADLKNWYYATAKATDNYAANDSTRDDVTTTVFTVANKDAYNDNYGYNANDYVLAKTFSIRSTGDATATSKGLYVKDIAVTVAGEGAKQMHTALRVGFVCHTTSENVGIKDETFIFAPIVLDPAATDGNSPTDNYEVYRKPTAQELASNNQLTKVSVGTVKLKEENDNSILLLDGAIPNSTDKPVDVTILIWFEGEDHNLTSDKYDASNISVTVEFSSKEVVNTTSGS